VVVVKSNEGGQEILYEAKQMKMKTLERQHEQMQLVNRNMYTNACYKEKNFWAGEPSCVQCSMTIWATMPIWVKLKLHTWGPVYGLGILGSSNYCI
jgi:hypothetical protein